MKIDLGGVALLLTVIFATLKLTNVVAWSWWIVFAPLIAWVALVLAILLVVGIIVLGVAIAASKS